MSRRPRAAALVAAATALLAAPAGAQIGYPTAESPFVDLEYRQSTTVFGGWFNAAKEPAGIAPQSGPLVGMRYDIFLGGPAYFTGRIASAISERTVLDPARPAGRRVLGTERRPLTLADVGLTLGLTGQKSWRGLVPTVHGGIGVVSNLASADPGGYRFGTRFSIPYGLGLRYVPRDSPWALRADVGAYLYQIRYPDSYSTPALDSTSILPSGSSKSRWTNNLSATIGLSYQFSR